MPKSIYFTKSIFNLLIFKNIFVKELVYYFLAD